MKDINQILAENKKKIRNIKNILETDYNINSNLKLEFENIINNMEEVNIKLNNLKFLINREFGIF